MIWSSLQACGVVLSFAISTSICLNNVTICSGLYLLRRTAGLEEERNRLRGNAPRKGRCVVGQTRDASFAAGPSPRKREQ